MPDAYGMCELGPNEHTAKNLQIIWRMSRLQTHFGRLPPFRRRSVEYMGGKLTRVVGADADRGDYVGGEPLMSFSDRNIALNGGMRLIAVDGKILDLIAVDAVWLSEETHIR